VKESISSPLGRGAHEANVPDQRFRESMSAPSLLDACVNAGVKRFVHGSTIGVYGHASQPVDENSPCHP
jgi:UDP-glucose 4-epimerase